MKTNYLNITKTSKYFLSAIFCLTLLASCSDDDDNDPPNDEEVITNVTLAFINVADATDTITLLSVDLDGEDGPMPPAQTVTGDFTAGATYTATIELFNAIEGEDITEEVRDDEPDEHFFVYAINGLDMEFSRSAGDVVRTDGNSLGYATTWIANTTGTGTITVQLYHESESVDDSNGFGTQVGGSTDVNITFLDVDIQ